MILLHSNDMFTKISLIIISLFLYRIMAYNTSMIVVTYKVFAKQRFCMAISNFIILK